ncbi:hypothetical protein [Pseudoalteromonas rubra]|uniref:Uncharacterized protein n=1 Tax=Pseudoalteromonas rubra TaxID=43658 RepID=A0A0U3GXY2_9GAMM|nr:hypothetical protein [Pseudoalteromonas rubra]ALU45182.1 hypothetical protein AT705_19660 [Pseudoalteromonas rubra]
MSVIKTFFLALVIMALCFVGSLVLDESVAKVPFVKSTEFTNQDKAYQFDVPADGQMMRFELKGVMKMNTWKAIDMEVYQADGTYLFSYHDELWSESGRDSEGKWTEHRKEASFKIRFAKKGSYQMYLTDQSSNNQKLNNTRYYFRVVPVRGDASVLKPLFYIALIVAFLCFTVLGNRYEEDKPLSGKTTYNKKPYGHNPLGDQARPSRAPLYAWCFSLGLFALLFSWAYKNDDDINYVSYAYGKSQMTVDRSIRQQSMSGANHRGGSGRGGK